MPRYVRASQTERGLPLHVPQSISELLSCPLQNHYKLAQVVCAILLLLVPITDSIPQTDGSILHNLESSWDHLVAFLLSHPSGCLWSSMGFGLALALVCRGDRVGRERESTVQCQWWRLSDDISWSSKPSLLPTESAHWGSYAFYIYINQ